MEKYVLTNVSQVFFSKTCFFFKALVTKLLCENNEVGRTQNPRTKCPLLAKRNYFQRSSGAVFFFFKQLMRRLNCLTAKPHTPDK